MGQTHGHSSCLAALGRPLLPLTPIQGVFCKMCLENLEDL